MREGMALDPGTSTVVNVGNTVTVTTPDTIDNPSPPPLYYNVSLTPGLPLSSAITDRGAPPSYEDAVDPNAPPPSYESLFGRVREAHKSRKNVFDFLQNVLILLLGTIGCTIILGTSILIPICMIVIGGLYLYDCPQGEYIPIYLLVGGGFGILKQVLDRSTIINHLRGINEEERRIKQSSTLTLINCFMLCWFIIGSMWVYKEYEPNYDPTLGKYCNKTLYLFAFWLITSIYILLALTIGCICSISLGSILFQ
ncbi:hypothetical protein QAD02_016167 [Eretmocerus hayati]|uniref:Uncharacterized protein n=1 Tax=Eretmocerus hayati TaxID=131215 RepID=A0ACC2P9V3_9HYME|nr:hypothetical protein QAD02_016167 [Eretmocerus hayati]